MIFFLEFNQGVIFQERPSARLLLLLIRASGHSSQSPRRCFSSLTFTTKAESLEREREREREAKTNRSQTQERTKRGTSEQPDAD